MHGQYVREMDGIDKTKTWQWLSKGDLKGCTEALIFSAQEQTLNELCVECVETKENVLDVWSVSVANLCKKNIRRGMIMWLDIYIGCSVES